MNLRIQILFIFCLTFFTVRGQQNIEEWIKFNDKIYDGVNVIKLYKESDNKKILVQSVDFNEKGKIIKESVFCNFLYDPLNEIEFTQYEYDSGDTLLISRKILDNQGDIINGENYSYDYNKKGQLIQKGITDITDNEFQKEVYTFNDKGLVSNFKIEFYNQTRDTVLFYFYRKYEYDESSNLIKESFVNDSIIELEEIYNYDSLGNVTSFTTKGIHECGDDIDRYKIKYNAKSAPTLEEYWNASGENWAFEFVYDNLDRLEKKIRKTRYPIKKESEISENSIPPPPPFYTQEMLEKNYTNEIEQSFSYDMNNRLIKVVKKYLWLDDFSETYLIEYE